MSTQRIHIDVPELDPLPYGLLSVADVADAGDPHLFNGFEYEQLCGYNTGYSANPCFGASASATNAGTTPWPVTVTIVTDLPGTYTVNWGDATGDTTVTITEGETSETTPAHNYTTTTGKTITITGPLGYGVRTITLAATNVVATTQANAFSKTPLPAYGTIVGQPLTIFAQHSCRPVGLTADERKDRATRALTVGNSWALEKALKATRLTGASVDVTNGTPTTPKRAFALLEHYAAKNYAGRPIIHVDRYTGAIAAADGIFARHGNRLETVQGALVASGAGYSATVEPIPATVDIYVTGMVRIRQGASYVHDGGQPSNQNEVTALAERTSIMSVECIVARAQVTTA
jgi:hypothetical protein